MRLFPLMVCFLLVGCGFEESVAPSVGCENGSEIEVYCGFYNPEDLVQIPGSGRLLVSEMGEFQVHEPSSLALLNMTTGQREPIEIDWQTDQSWGDATCQAPDPQLFSPHGIDLTERADGAQQLLVVNHGGRESVEFFELVASDGLSLNWRGCAIPPGDPFINDVAGLADGGFFVTHMWDKNTAFPVLVAKLLAGSKTGWVYEWQAETGFKKLESSVEMMPNGIAVNADNTKIFVNIYMGNKTIRIDRASGEVDGELAVQQPDNITVDDEGQIWIASHRHDPINDTCTEPGVCLLPFAVVKADPLSLETEEVLSHQGAPMGYSTVALRVENTIYLGSAHGDRIASFKIGE